MADSYRYPHIPRFLPNDPSLWFLQVDSSFNVARITTELTQADTVIEALGPDVLACIKDIISVRPRPVNLYTQIKERITSSYAVSAETRLRQLLKGEVLTPGKPSFILTRLRNLNEFGCSNAVLRSILLDQLPPHVRAILSVGDLEDLKALAQIADKIVETYQPNTFQSSEVSAKPAQNQQIAAVAHTAPTSDALEPTLRQIIQRLDKVEAASSRSRAPSRSGPSQRNRARSSSRNSRRLCYYHSRCGKEAHRCNQPCD
ncbi:uncharacterized protein LOC117171067 [Belonocnema kinseyi]|uniref:uncharacterized protein LOC117171067 n=1 Tax=Belonocnema kinseyi TaxID=2817044 RepID=UPI00143CD98E|nr:uncharacterized protein LOC117171067 [Belonocnema kinseyi]